MYAKAHAMRSPRNSRLISESGPIGSDKSGVPFYEHQIKKANNTVRKILIGPTRVGDQQTRICVALGISQMISENYSGYRSDIEHESLGKSGNNYLVSISHHNLNSWIGERT